MGALKDNPLLGQEWCSESACEHCLVSDLTMPFCSCNIWTGGVTQCPAYSTDMQYIKTSPYKITLKSHSKLLKHETISGKTNYSDMNRFLKKAKKKKADKKTNKKKKPGKKTNKKKKKNSNYLCKEFYKDMESVLQEKCDASIIKIKCEKNLVLKFKATMFFPSELNEPVRATMKNDLESCINEYFTADESDESFETLCENTDTDYAVIKSDGEMMFSKGF